MCQISRFPVAHRIASPMVATPATLSEAIIAQRRSIRSTIVPATGPMMIAGTDAARITIASDVTDPVSPKTKKKIPNWVSPVPRTEISWPPQTMKKVRIPERSLASVSTMLKRLSHESVLRGRFHFEISGEFLNACATSGASGQPTRPPVRPAIRAERPWFQILCHKCWSLSPLAPRGLEGESLVVSTEQAPEVFARFFSEAEPRLRHALSASYGPEIGREAAADALEYSWAHWSRVSEMEYPVAYLYRVGQSAAKRYRRRKGPGTAIVVEDQWFEPALLPALGRLTERQRTAVVLRFAFDYRLAEIGDLLGISVPTVQKHVDRAMAKLRKVLEVGT